MLVRVCEPEVQIQLLRFFYFIFYYFSFVLLLHPLTEEKGKNLASNDLAMSIPTTPIPPSDACTHNSTHNTITTTTNTIPLSPLQCIYTNSFQFVGTDYLDHVVQELAQLTQARTVLIQQLVPFKDYADHLELAENKLPLHLITSHDETSPTTFLQRRETTPSSDDKADHADDDTLLVVRASSAESSPFKCL